MITAFVRIAMLGALFLMAGCDWYAKGGHNQNGPWVEGGVSGKFLTQGVPIGTYSVSAFNAEQFVVVLEPSGTAIVNTGGQVLVTLYNGTSTIASRYFAYVNSNGNIVAANPNSIQSWVGAYSNVSEIKYRIADLVSQPSAGSEQSALTSTTVYNGDPVASATSSWANTGGGGGCTRTRCQQY